MATKPPSGTLINPMNPFATKMVAGYFFNEGSGTTVLDATGHGHAITLNLTALSWGTSAIFTGPTVVSAATAGTTGGTIAGLGDFQPSWSIEVWITYQTSDSYAALLQGSTAIHPFPAGLYLHNGKMDLYRAGDHDGTATLSAGTNSQLVVTCDGTNMRYYINSALDKTTTLNVGNLYTPLLICNDTGSQTFVGKYDLLFIWDDRTLSADEIVTRYNDPLDVGTTSVVSQFFLGHY